MTQSTVTLKCDMDKTCTHAVTHIGAKGWIYCASHAATRNASGWESCRRLRAWEVALVKAGETLPSYQPIRKPVHA